MSPNVCSVEEDHTEGRITVFQSLEKGLPDPELGPAEEKLRCGPPRAEVRRDGAPFRTVLMAPEYGRDGPAQVTRRRLAFRANHLDQGLPDPPRIIGNHRLRRAHHIQLCTPERLSRHNRT